MPLRFDLTKTDRRTDGRIRNRLVIFMDGFVSKRVVWAAPLLLAPQILFQNCSRQNFSAVASVTATETTSSGLGDTVCGPFGGDPGGGSTAANGVSATLTYLPTTSPQVQQYGSQLTTASFAPTAPNVQLVPNPVFLNSFSVYTQWFSSGFDNNNGQTLKDLNGDVLDSYFSLEASGSIELSGSANDAPGEYQFALLADDGAIFSIADTQGNFHTVVNDDAVQSNTFACATTTVNFQGGVPVPYKLNYFQGPPVRIAIMLFWRKVDPNNPETMADPLCPSPTYKTTEDDDYFFENSATTQSSPTSAYAALLSRGWQVVPSSNLFLPRGTTNPCQ